MVAARPDVDMHTRPVMLTPPIRPPHRPSVTGPPAPAPKPRSVATTQVREYVEQINLLQVICWQAAAIAVLLTVFVLIGLMQLPTVAIVFCVAPVSIALAYLAMRSDSGGAA